MHNKVVNDLRQAKHRQAFSINEFAEAWSPEFHVEPAQERGNLLTRDIKRCLAEINPSSRKVLLAVPDAKRYEDVAQAAGISLATMRLRLHRGRVRLQELMYGTKKPSLYAPRRMSGPDRCNTPAAAHAHGLPTKRIKNADITDDDAGSYPTHDRAAASIHQP